MYICSLSWSWMSHKESLTTLNSFQERRKRRTVLTCCTSCHSFRRRYKDRHSESEGRSNRNWSTHLRSCWWIILWNESWLSNRIGFGWCEPSTTALCCPTGFGDKRWPSSCNRCSTTCYHPSAQRRSQSVPMLVPTTRRSIARALYTLALLIFTESIVKFSCLIEMWLHSKERMQLL